MFRKLVKSAEIEIDGRTYVARYFEQQTARGSAGSAAKWSSKAGDRIIVDDDSLTSLESKVERLVPATVYSRVLAAAGRRSGLRKHRRARRYKTETASGAPFGRGRAGGRCAGAAYLRGRTVSFSCFAMRALTTVLAGILIASPVAGLRPMRALRSAPPASPSPAARTRRSASAPSRPACSARRRTPAPASASLRSDPRNARRVLICPSCGPLPSAVPLAWARSTETRFGRAREQRQRRN